MTYFLEKIAATLYTEFGTNLNRHCLVFPNRRAGLYFLKYLASGIDKPVWAPSVLTINDLFRFYSELNLAGNEILLFELYKVYRKLTKIPESFDEFYFWGDMLLNDFEDIDKYMVDASTLFSNVSDIKEIDQKFGGLTEAQIEIVRRFWINFNPEKPSNEKSGFISVWSVLSALYNDFRRKLKEKNLAYEGMIFREVAEDHNKGPLSDSRWDMVHFIGFNALNECEKVLMGRFKKAGMARFYWDYDNSYINGPGINSAGLFLRDNIGQLGNDMPVDWNYDTILSAGNQNVKRRVIDASSDVAQVKLISELIGELPGLTSENAHHTAVVLADENLLMPVLTSLPENVGDINITMGHPLKQTLVYTLLRHMMDLQSFSSIENNVILFGYKDVFSILKHPLISPLMIESDNDIISDITSNNYIRVPSSRFEGSPRLNRVFQKPASPGSLSEYFKEILSLIVSGVEESEDKPGSIFVQRSIINEFIYRIVLSVNRLEAILTDPDITFSTDTYIRILDRMLRMQSVPFSGEPLSGIQVMGILETRALDFKNLIILSVNEGVLPSSSAGLSFIPYSLREAFGLPSVNHQESVYAYHFYRLLQRAENVTFTYNSNSEGLRSGEMSRFLIQMKYEQGLKPDFTDLSFEIKTQASIGDKIERTREHQFQLYSQFLKQENTRTLSPSAINTWLSCRMKFYYRYVNHLKEPETVTSDIDPAMLGNILHEVLKSLYSNFTGKIISVDNLDSIIANKTMFSKIIDATIRKNFITGNDDLNKGNEHIVREILAEYLLRILRADKSLAPFSILNLEDSFHFSMKILLKGIQENVKIGGTIDRIDRVAGVTRIVDYKTGTVADSLDSVGELFNEERKKDNDAWLQTLLYCEAYLADKTDTTVRPSVYKIKKLDGTKPSDLLRIKGENKSEIEIEDYVMVRDEYLMGLKSTVENIFSDDEPFVMTSDIRDKCTYCPYRALCMR